MHIWANKQAGSAAVEESSMLVSSTGAVGRRLQHPVWIRRDLIMDTNGISNSIPFEADISIKRLHHHVNGLHHYYGVEGTTACQGSS